MSEVCKKMQETEVTMIDREQKEWPLGQQLFTDGTVLEAESSEQLQCLVADSSRVRK